jgi:pSer/pThr/pTyr-binding forkhead associated (FHA) protein
VNLLGRGRRSVVPVESRSVSRLHAQIVVDSGAAVLEDLGSRSGTFVGESRVSGAVALRAGDRILLGSELIGTIEILAPPDSTITEFGARS